MSAVRCFLLLLFISSTAWAAGCNKYAFRLAGDGQTSTGTLVVDESENGHMLHIRSITGDVNGVAIQALLPPSGYDGNNNILDRASHGFVPNAGGFSFRLRDGTVVNIFSFRGTHFLTRSNLPRAVALKTSFSIVGVPAPRH